MPIALRICLLASLVGSAAGQTAAPVLSYSPDCPDPAVSCSTFGTEIQALEGHDGALYAGTTQWMESNPSLWPGRNAQVLVLRERGGVWEPTPDFPTPAGRCTGGEAAWEQVNALVSVRADGQSALLAALFPNEDGECADLNGDVYRLAGDRWVSTGLEPLLRAHYGTSQSEVRYLAAHADGTDACTETAPCLFALAGPRRLPPDRRGASVWKAAVTANGIEWASEPEARFDGDDLPFASRLVSVLSAPGHLLIGTQADPTAAGGTPDRCRDPDAPECLRPSLVQRDAGGAYRVLWRADPWMDSSIPPETAVRGIARTPTASGDALFALTLPRSRVYRFEDNGSGSYAEPVLDVVLADAAGAGCGLYGYQLFVTGSLADGGQMLVANQSCVAQAPTVGRVLARSLDGDTWTALELPAVTDADGPLGGNAAAIRWFEASPFQEGEIYFGTTDMNSMPGTRTARIYRWEIASVPTSSAPEPEAIALRLSPNPTAGLVQAHLPDGVFRVAVWDVMGRRVATFNARGSVRIPTESLAPGRYLVEAVDAASATRYRSALVVAR